MTTICEPVQESLSHACEPNCLCKNPDVCPPECPHYTKSTNKRITTYIFNVLGIIVAILATYMIVSTDSKLYLVFWICYSVLRRMMLKSKKHLKAD